MKELETYFEGCRRHSDADFLILPGEEANAYLGGHYNILFPKPVYWTMVRGKGQPLVEDDPKYGTVYHAGSAADLFEMMKREDALVWTTHPRTKGSTGYPDKIKDTDYFRSDRWLGAAFKALPVDLSQKRLGEVRCFGTLDDMNNWGGPKYMVGEVDTYKKFPDYDLYGDFNVNYVKLDRVPRFDDWSPICNVAAGRGVLRHDRRGPDPELGRRRRRQGPGGGGRGRVDVPAGVRRGGLGRRRASGPDRRLGDGPAAVRVPPVPHPVRCVGQEVGPLLGLGLGGQRGVHAAGAFEVRRKGSYEEPGTCRRIASMIGSWLSWSPATSTWTPDGLTSPSQPDRQVQRDVLRRGRAGAPGPAGRPARRPPPHALLRAPHDAPGAGPARPAAGADGRARARHPGPRLRPHRRSTGTTC